MGNTALRFLHRDAQGSVRATTGGAGGLEERFLYRPYGTQIPNSPNGTLATKQSKGWIGERYDGEAGLQYLNARYYDPDLAMFIQPDWWEVTEPGVGTNRYSYAGGDPVNGVDPGGHAEAAAASTFWDAIVSFFSGTSATTVASSAAKSALGVNPVGLAIGVVGIVVDPGDPTNGDPCYDNMDCLDQSNDASGTTAAGSIAASPGSGCEEQDQCDEVGSGGNAETERPDGVPRDWIQKSAKDGKGTIWSDPKNPGNNVRIMNGNQTSEFPTSRSPYVRWFRDGHPLDQFGKVLRSEQFEGAHIAFKDFKFLPGVFK